MLAKELQKLSLTKDNCKVRTKGVKLYMDITIAVKRETETVSVFLYASLEALQGDPNWRDFLVFFDGEYGLFARYVPSIEYLDL